MNSNHFPGDYKNAAELRWGETCEAMVRQASLTRILEFIINSY